MKRALLLLVLVAGCSVGPSYEQPALEAPAAFTNNAKECGDISRWWTSLNDPELDSLVERALENNWDVKRAVAALREGRWLRAGVLATFLPSLDLDATAKREKISQNAPHADVPQFDLRHTDYRGGFDAAWEIDIWGGKRRGFEQAGATYDATREEMHEVMISLCAEVARNYVELRGAQRRLAVAADGVRGQQEIYDLVKARFDAGLANDLDMARSEADLQNLKARIPGLQASADRSRHAIAVLIGAPAASLDLELADARPVPVPPKTTAAGLPVDLLKRRPDLRKAERRLAAATAEIGVKVDAMLPHVSLIGTYGIESIDATLLFRNESIYGSIGPSLQWRIFSLPQLYSQVKAADARAEQALDAYHQAFLNALREVEDTLAETAGEDARREALSLSVESNGRAVTLAKELYRQGLVSLLDVLEAEKGLLNAQSELASSDTLVATNRVALYKALGGGWYDVSVDEDGD